jgi:DNA-binding MarR family transcriptional regulator
MDQVFFSLKRAYHGTLRVARAALVKLPYKGLTPARFDMLHALRSDDFLDQRALQDVLGVTKTVVSRMVRSLEELGYVARERDPEDRRTVVVWLTELGSYCIECAGEMLVASGLISREITRALTGPPRFVCERNRRLDAREKLRTSPKWRRRRLLSLLRMVRCTFKARGRLEYYAALNRWSTTVQALGPPLVF